MMSELGVLAKFVREFDLDSAPDGVLDAARYCVLDSVGSALGAGSSAEIQSITDEFSEWGFSIGTKDASVWGHGHRTNVFPALLINGMMSHELEMDDVHANSKSHIGAVVVPAAWTLADALGLTGRKFIEAVIVGYEVMSRIGMGMDVSSNRKRGWHTTGIIGTFGAAAASARLLGIDAKRTVSALGMAGTQSSGLWAFLADGSTCKKLHTARASINGLVSAILAKAGMTGPPHILDAPDGGLYRAVSDSFDTSAVTSGLGEVYEITKMDKKPYPCCRTTHHAIDGALGLRKEHCLAPEDISEILVETYDVGVLQCGAPIYPASPVEAKFSIPYTVAAAFVYGKVTLDEFRTGAIDSHTVREIAENTKVIGIPLFTEKYPARWGSRVTVTTKDARKLSRQIDDMSGSVALPLTREQEETKFTGLASAVFTKPRTDKTMIDILGIESLERMPDLA
ncbi:MAG: MmgE/PrpD family protein [Synergistaceae bacterium]|jgi:2-methylcitrate dehydratase PrpD|nr:MmgE/PrpD family protein [Synergistaceae bacterium]